MNKMKNNSVISLPSGKTLTLKITHETRFNNRVRMKKSSRDKWVKALESGRYKQTSGVLFSPECDGLHYCCLGVKARIDRCKFDKIYERVIFPKHHMEDTAQLPSDYELGLGGLGPFQSFKLLSDDRKFEALSELNDRYYTFDHCYDFKDIAHVIRLFF
jgi:hypothetical protein